MGKSRKMKQLREMWCKITIKKMIKSERTGKNAQIIHPGIKGKIYLTTV